MAPATSAPPRKFSASTAARCAASSRTMTLSDEPAGAPAVRTPIRRALISVSDKAGVLELAHALVSHGVALLSTGGTAQLLREAGLAVTEVSSYTGFPEIMDGRVKTL